MGKGISVFLGMDYSLDEILELIRFSNKHGFDRIFTSLHIPEANYSVIVKEFKEVLKEANKLNMKIIADISPQGFEFLGNKDMKLEPLREMGIHVLRLDFGFTNEKIAELTRNDLGIKIEINASTITERFFKDLDQYKPNYSNMQSCHNYYPRNNTGISEEILLRRNESLIKRGVEVSAFIPSLAGKRGPIYEGLPTMEIHRNIDPYISAKHLYALGNHNVFFGDAMPSKEEIVRVGNIDESVIELRVDVLDNSDIAKKYLTHDFYTSRPDGAEDVIRGAEGRLILNKGEVIEKGIIKERNVGDITLDNKGYLRYMGEIQIIKTPLNKDERVNKIGSVIEEERFLLKYIDEENKFKFITL